ncbi:MAG: UxaA family hydrolase [Quisquiliibacterium sp.]
MSTTVDSAAPLGHLLREAAAELQWQGFRRSDGRVGCRNLLMVLSTVALTDRLALDIVGEDTDVTLISGAYPRGLRGADGKRLSRQFLELLRHPNVGATLLLVHDAAAARLWREQSATLGRPVEILAFMEHDGRAAAIAEGRRKLAKLRLQLPLVRSTARLGDLFLSLECGGSDVSSGVCSNPVIGDLTDLVVGGGGSAVVSETAEFIGAEPVVVARTPDPAVRNGILARIAARERSMNEDDEQDYRGVNPTPENLAGGLTTLVEKSMGAVSKTGSSAFVSALDFGERPVLPGLHFMDTPFFSPLSLAAMAMSGATIGLFAMGVFNPTGCPLTPIVKVCGNPGTVARWGDDIDVDLSPMLVGGQSRRWAAERLLQVFHEIYHGSPCAAERAREGQIMFLQTAECL